MERLIGLVQKLGTLLAVAVVSYFAEQGSDGGFIKDVWNAAKTASPFAAMFAILMFFDERRERREAQRQCNERTIDFIKATSAAAQVFERALARMSGQRVRRKRR